MRASKMLLPTLKEAPNEAIIDSHILMLRAGLMKKLVAGVYTYLPVGLRVLHKIEQIIREEMDAAGALEILASALQPKELWEASGRWHKYGPELIRLKDRHDREFCLGPTHEEIFTDLIQSTVKSGKVLPLNIYQIQTKYRDEIRPRFGLIRGREFIMKDAYSFDTTEEGLEVSYQSMYTTYARIFTRLGINYQVVLADTGAIGGNGSHQFMALSEIGESTIIYCPHCEYAADEEKARSVLPKLKEEEELSFHKIATLNRHTIEEVATFLHCPQEKIAKTMVYYDSDKKTFAAFMVRGDCEVNEIKVVNVMQSSEAFIRLATEDEILSLGSFPGFIGPKGLSIPVFVDEELVPIKNLVIGANEKDYHYENAIFGRDFEGTVIDCKKAKAGDICPECGQVMQAARGIEVGQIFKLGTKYSASMNCVYNNEEGKPIPMVMGCYGIGVTRTLQSIIEQHHDTFGIVFPLQVAPYHLVIVPVNDADSIQKAVGEEIYRRALASHIEVIYDDRDNKVGFKLKDWDLMGVPYQIVVGKRAGESIVEWKDRSTNVKEELTIEEAIKRIQAKVNEIK